MAAWHDLARGRPSRRPHRNRLLPISTLRSAEVGRARLQCRLLRTRWTVRFELRNRLLGCVYYGFGPPRGGGPTPGTFASCIGAGILIPASRNWRTTPI